MSNDSNLRIEVSLTRQRLQLLDGAEVVAEYRVSTSRFGVMGREHSQCTPTGMHVVDEMFGAGEPPLMAFTGRVATGDIWSEELDTEEPDRDWILSRIMWLAGTEPGVNQGEGCDSKSRYIYIHGTTPLEPMGVPRSHGCVRMDPVEVIDLFDRVKPGTSVNLIA